jgi:signal transduction histidine kinase
MAPRTRIVRSLTLGVGVALGWLEWQASPNAERPVLVFDIAVGFTFFVAAAMTLELSTARRAGLLLVAAGATWFAGAVVPAISSAYVGFLAHFLMTYPNGRLDRAAQHRVVAIGYAVALPASIVDVAGLESALLAVVAVTALVNASATDGPLRRGRFGAGVGAGLLAATFAVIAVGLAVGTLDFSAARILSASAVISVTAALAVDLRWGGWSRDALARLVIDLGERAEGTTLRDRLAAALDDPTLAIGYRLGETDAYVDDDGRPLDIPAPGSGRVAVPLHATGHVVAVLVRDERWPIDPVLAEGVAAAAELALGNVRLHAENRRQMTGLEASRSRLIVAAEAERQRIRRELDGGAMRRLAAVRETLEASEALGPERGALLDHASIVMGQLAELSEGLGPVSVLSDGLRPALDRLASESPVRTVAHCRVGRLPALLEATAYFVCAEALANVVKHARASRVSIRARELGDSLTVEVLDDGVGGAVGSPGSGLDGLRQRVETTGGRLAIEGRHEGGTRVLAVLPIDRQGSGGSVRVPADRRA